MTAEQDDRRRLERVLTDKPVELIVGPDRYTGTVIDISLRGLLARLDGPTSPAQGDWVHAKVRLDDGPCFIELDGEIAHASDRQIGIHCSTLDVDSAARLRRMVELNLGEERSLERELVQMVADAQR